MKQNFTTSEFEIETTNRGYWSIKQYLRHGRKKAPTEARATGVEAGAIVNVVLEVELMGFGG